MGAPIRTMIIAAVIILTYAWAVIGFIGSYQLNNNIAMNATLKSQYEAVVGNSTNAGPFGTLNNLTSQGKTQGEQLGGLNTLNSIGMAAQFFQSIPALYSSIAYLITTPMASILGISLSVPEANILFLVIIMIVLAVLSAIFLFPL